MKMVTKRYKIIKNYFLKILPLILLINFFVIIFYYSITNLSRKSTVSILKNIEPIFLAVNFALIIVSLIANLKDLKKLLKPIKKNVWISLLLIFILGFFLRMYVAPHTHRVFFDEDIYLDIGKEILTRGEGCLCNYGDYKGCYECEVMKWPIGYPFTAAISFLFFGISESVAFNLNILLSSLSIILVFLIGYLLTKKDKVGLYSALLFALIPVHIMWSATTASEPIYVFYSLLAIFAFLLSIKLDTLRSSLFAISCLAFACYFRAEGGIIIGLIAFMMLLFDKRLIKKIDKPKFLVPWLIFFVLIIPYAIHVYHFSRIDPWGSKGKMFGLEYAKNNVLINAWFWLMGYETIEHPILFTIFAIIGLIYTLRKEKKTSLFLVFWFLAFFLIYAFFYAGSVLYGVDVRYSLSDYPPLILLGGFGLYFIHSSLNKRFEKDSLIFLLLATIVLISFCFYVPSISTPAEEIREANQARTYHDFVVEFSRGLDKDCYVLSHVPSIYLVQDKGSLQTWNGQNEKRMRELFEKTDCVIFDDGFWCNIEPYESSVCKHIFDNFKLTPLDSVDVDQGRHTYTLYKIENPYD